MSNLSLVYLFPHILQVQALRFTSNPTKCLQRAQSLSPVLGSHQCPLYHHQGPSCGQRQLEPCRQPSFHMLIYDSLPHQLLKIFLK